VDQRILVERARGGDRDAFAVLARASATRLDAAARLILLDREHARDAVQEALIRAWRDLPGLRDPDRFDAWLYRLLSHAAIDEARRRRRRVVEVDITSIDVSGPDDPVATFAERDALERALAGLSPEHRALVVMHFYLGLTLPEAAEAQGISLGAAKSRLHRAISSLRRSFVETSDRALPAARGGQP
jgi:RNA polymerase sigma-70 factor (ECF subfamily)